MTDVEREKDGSPNIYETIARFLLGQIKMADMDENNRVTLSYYLGLMYEDPKLKEIVYAKMNQIQLAQENGKKIPLFTKEIVYAKKDGILLAQENGKKIPLFTKEELSKAKKHRKRNTTSERAFQPALFDERVKEVTDEQEIIFDSDPEKGLAGLHKMQESPFIWNKNKLISKEIQQKRQELRDRIGLPVARGKSEHVNDDFYKFLVRRIVNFDAFGIFCEFDRVVTQTAPELDAKIGEVKGLVSELLNGPLNRQERFRRFHEFSREYTEKWSE